MFFKSGCNKFSNTIALLLFSVFFIVQNCYGRRIYIDEIKFAGNESFSVKILQSLMDSKPSSLFGKSTYSVFILNSDISNIESFYRNQGFINPEVSYKSIKHDKGKKVNIIITIKEGARIYIGAVRVSTNTLINDDILGVLTLHEGDPLQYDKMLSDASTIKDSLTAKGFLRCVVNSQVMIDSAALKGFIKYNVHPGPRIIAGDLIITGLKSVKRDVLTRELIFKKGDVLTSDKVINSEQNLFKTGIFNFLSIDPQIGDSVYNLPPEDTVVPIIINATEAKFLTLEVNAGYNGYELFNTSLAATYANVFQRAHSLTFDGYVSGIKQRVELIYGLPWIFIFPLNLSLGAYYQRNGHLFATIPLPYTGEFDGFTATISQNRTKYLSYSLELTWENTIRVSVPSPDTFTNGPPQGNTRSITGNLVYDKRNDIFNPTRGFINAVSTEVAGFGGGVNKFVKFTEDLRGYFPFKSSFSWASAITLGYGFPFGSSTVLPVQDQFYAGGSRSVRGYDLNCLVTDSAGNPVGGNVLLVFHPFEIQFPIFWLFNGAVFMDAGYVWSAPQDVNLRDIKYTAGPSLRLISPLGVIRFDVGFKLGRGGGYRMYLDFGRAF